MSHGYYIKLEGNNGICCYIIFKTNIVLQIACGMSRKVREVRVAGSAQPQFLFGMGFDVKLAANDSERATFAVIRNNSAGRDSAR